MFAHCNWLYLYLVSVFFLKYTWYEVSKISQLWVDGSRSKYVQCLTKHHNHWDRIDNRSCSIFKRWLNSFFLSVFLTFVNTTGFEGQEFGLSAIGWPEQFVRTTKFHFDSEGKSKWVRKLVRKWINNGLCMFQLYMNPFLSFTDYGSSFAGELNSIFAATQLPADQIHESNVCVHFANKTPNYQQHFYLQHSIELGANKI